MEKSRNGIQSEFNITMDLTESHPLTSFKTLHAPKTPPKRLQVSLGTVDNLY